jgi:hypothetical protein
VRNSWGDQWGINGHFHIATYPFNKLSQFDVTVLVKSPVIDPKTNMYVLKEVPTCGIIMFEPKYFGSNNPFDLSFNSILKSGEDREIKEDFTQPPSNCSSTNSNEIVYFFIGFMALLSLILFILIVVYTVDKTKNPTK